MKKKFYPGLLLILIICSGFCFGTELSPPEKNFEQLWKTFDQQYGIFIPKRVDWNLLYKVYRPKVTPETTDQQLHDIMCQMLGHLNDNHVTLSSPFGRFRGGVLQQIKNEGFSRNLIKQKYLNNDFKSKLGGRFIYGWLNKSIGYFHFTGFQDLAGSIAAIDEIIKTFKASKGIVIDIRNNFGGNDMVGKAIANRFTDKKRHYLTTQIRNSGTDHKNFKAPKYFILQPDGPIQYTKPIAVLMHRYSISAADNFALAMRTLPHATLVGETTSGCLADMRGGYRLPNGWRFSVSYTLFVDQNGFCWEGIGIPPDLRQVCTKEDINNKNDKVVELAIDMINSGALRPRPEMVKLPIVKNPDSN